jgi:tetratricopeptide (TPR) repeat protein
MAESRALYETSVALDPNIFQTLFGWAKMEETDRNFARARELLDAAERLAPGAPDVRMQKAVLLGREKRYDEAIAAIEDLERARGALGPIAESEKGMLLDKMGRHAEAFAAFSESKRKLREMSGMAYLADEANGLAARLTGFFTSARVNILPRAKARTDVAQPLFIVG